MLRKISTWFEETQENSVDSDVKYRKCDHVPCYDEGVFKAPKNSRATSHHHDNSQWYWFCKEHVREYNAKWNFYKGMNEDQAYQAYKNDLIWNRPSWSVGTNTNNAKSLYDPFNILNDGTYASPPYLSPSERDALAFFDLQFPFSADELQSAYRNLVKKNHPDIHKTKSAEEQIRKINSCYQLLKKIAKPL